MRWLIPLCGLLFMLPAFSQDNTPPARPADLQIDARVVSAMNAMGFRLLAELQAAEPGRNVFISPASIQLALAMTMNGAQGPTREAMATAMGLEGLTLEQVNAGNAQLLSLLRTPDPKVELSVANSLWARHQVAFRPDFLQRVTTSYEAALSTLDFLDPAAAAAINAWVSARTRGKIPTLVDQAMLRDALLVLVNAIYFNGTWTTPFDKKATGDGPFTLADGTKKTLPMMFQRGRYAYQENEQFQAISLPYGAGNVVMDLVLPRPDADPAAFRQNLTAGHWAQWTQQFNSREGSIRLPRFKASYAQGLKPVLTQLGMGVAFTEHADFHGMLADERAKVAISQVIHKTVLEVNEEGTVAAAVTGVVMATLSMPIEPFAMVVDRPFFLVIRDVPTGAILFMGMINNPE